MAASKAEWRTKSLRVVSMVGSGYGQANIGLGIELLPEKTFGSDESDNKHFSKLEIAAGAIRSACRSGSSQVLILDKRIGGATAWACIPSEHMKP